MDPFHFVSTFPTWLLPSHFGSGLRALVFLLAYYSSYFLPFVTPRSDVFVFPRFPIRMISDVGDRFVNIYNLLKQCRYFSKLSS